jgi:hypothetical protein
MPTNLHGFGVAALAALLASLVLVDGKKVSSRMNADFFLFRQ